MRRSNISVSLDGHGSDELLGGYHFFVEAAIAEMYGSAFRPGRFLDLKRVHAGLVGGTFMGGSGELLSHRGTMTELTTLAKQVLRRLGLLGPLRRVAAATLSRWTGVPKYESLLPPLTGYPNLLGNGPVEPRLAPAGALQKILYTWFHDGLLPTFLRCIDRASMAHGIEVRAPFLDWRLVTLAFGLPDESKIGGGYTKRILRLAMDGIMPDEIRLRTQKIHFSSPIGDWARGRLGPRLLDIGASQAFREASAWNGRVARGAIENAVAGKSPITDIWPVVNAYMLQQAFVNAAQEASRSLVDA
jgi:asparagine synthase (glutamine-hydrolysing)